MAAVRTDGHGPLARWYGNPLAADQARTLLTTAEQRRTRARSRRCRTCLLQAVIARFWLGDDVTADVGRLSALLRTTPHGAALVELIYGQLLMSRRLHGAMSHLDRGFHRASRLLAADDYFILLRRHQLLARLPLSDGALPAANLATLMTTAAVIARMEPHPHSVQRDAGDIYG